MSDKEYQKKLESYQRSAAPVEVIEAAIEKLNIERYGINRRNKAILTEINNGESELRMGEI